MDVEAEVDDEDEDLEDEDMDAEAIGKGFWIGLEDLTLLSRGENIFLMTLSIKGIMG